MSTNATGSPITAALGAAPRSFARSGPRPGTPSATRAAPMKSAMTNVAPRTSRSRIRMSRSSGACSGSGGGIVLVAAGAAGNGIRASWRDPDVGCAVEVVEERCVRAPTRSPAAAGLWYGTRRGRARRRDTRATAHRTPGRPHTRATASRTLGRPHEPSLLRSCPAPAADGAPCPTRDPAPSSRRSGTTTSSRRTRARPPSSHIDLHLVHEVTSAAGLRRACAPRGLRVRRPERTVATADHSTSDHADAALPILDQMAAAQIDALETNCAEFGIRLHDLAPRRRGSST